MFYCTTLLFITLQTCLLGVYRNHLVRPSVHMYCKLNFSLMNEPILMKLYTVVVYHLRMCIKEDKSGLNNVKGDNKEFRDPFVIWLTVLVLYLFEEGLWEIKFLLVLCYIIYTYIIFNFVSMIVYCKYWVGRCFKVKCKLWTYIEGWMHKGPNCFFMQGHSIAFTSQLVVLTFDQVCEI